MENPEKEMRRATASAGRCEVRRPDGAANLLALLKLRVPAAIFAAWERLSPLSLRLYEGLTEVALLAPGAHAGVGCDGSACASRAKEAGVLTCLEDGRRAHLAAPVRPGDAPVGATLVSGAFERGRGHGIEAEALLAEVLAIAAREMAVVAASRGDVPAARMGGLSAILGSSAKIASVLRSIERIAPTERLALVIGETGTGKELVTRAIHDLSRRAAGPFVVVHCGAIPEGLLESELFGHAKGAFTGAVAERKGLFEAADKGTLFLDEVPSMSLAFQAKLLRVLEQGTFHRVGGTKSLRADVRVIAASNVDLRARVQEGQFREDLYHRLRVLEVVIPPLRERTEDILSLARHFIALTCAEEGMPAKALGACAERALLAHTWPGNVRELRHAMERAVIQSAPEVIRAADLGAELGGSVPETSHDLEGARRDAACSASATGSFRVLKREELERWERAFLAKELADCDGNQSLLARRLHMSRRKLGIKVQRYGLRASMGGGASDCDGGEAHGG